MANDRIVAWLKLRDIARFVADAKMGERAIKKIKDASKDAEGPVAALGGALGNLQGVLPKARTETGIFGLTLGSIVTVLTLGMPIIMSFIGAITALAGSFGAAALGAGSLAVALGGVALAAGPLALVAMDMFKGFTKVNTAFGAWQKALSMYGPNSKQAETALGRLNAVADQFGGPTLISLVQRWNDFMTSFRNANAPAVQNIIKLFGMFLTLAQQLLPVFSYMSRVVSSALVVAFRKMGVVLASSNIGLILRGLADTFARLSGPLSQGILNLFIGLLTLASRAAPALGWLFNEFVGFTTAFRNWAANGPVNALIGQFQSWWNLTKAIGGLLVTILSAGAGQGKGLVDTLTAIVNKWNDWLSSMKGQSSLHKFFSQSIAIFKVVIGAVATLITWLWKLGRALMPIYIVAFRALAKGWHEVMDALKPAMPFFRNVVIPLFKGIAKGVLIGLVGAFKFLIAVLKVVAPVLGFIGKILSPLKGVFEAVGVVIGFVFGGEILDAMTALGKLTGFFKPLGKLFELLGVPIRAAGRLIAWFGGVFGSIVERLAFKVAARFLSIRNAVYSVIDFLTGAGAKFANAAVRLWKLFSKSFVRAIGQGLGFAGNIGKAVYNFIAGHINRALPNHIGPIDLPNNPIPMMATGGVVSGSGSWITGEMGPEINTLRNGQVTVVPLSPAVKAQSATATLAPNEKRVLVSKVFLKGRQIAEAVADEAEAEAARR